MIIVRNCNSDASPLSGEGELTLDQMLADPIVRLVMARDGVTEAQVRAVMQRAAASLRPPFREAAE